MMPRTAKIKRYKRDGKKIMLCDKKEATVRVPVGMMSCESKITHGGYGERGQPVNPVTRL